MAREILHGGAPAVTGTGERIRAFRHSKKMTQKEFSASLGIVQGFLCAIEKGRKIPSDTLMIAIQNLYGINPEWLAGGIGEIYLEKPSSSPQVQGKPAIPLLKAPPTSLELLSDATFEDFISMPEVPDGCFAFVYAGDFMSPTIRDRDIVIIQPGNRPVSGDIILIVSLWGDSFLRRYRRRGDEVFCSADNSSYSSFRFTDNTEILGVVHAVWRRVKI